MVVMFGWNMLLALSPSEAQCLRLNTKCAALPAHFWHAVAKSGWICGCLVLSEGIPQGSCCWCEAPSQHSLGPVRAHLGFARRILDGLVPH